jgi:hypothetical protein
MIMKFSYKLTNIALKVVENGVFQCICLLMLLYLQHYLPIKKYHDMQFYCESILWNSTDKMSRHKWEKILTIMCG